jgi:hypothetical protein
MIAGASKRPFASAPPQLGSKRERAPHVTSDTLSEKLIHLGGGESERTARSTRRHFAPGERERILTQAARGRKKGEVGVHKMLACISARGKAKHSNTCFMTSKLVRSATPVKEDHSFLSLLLYLFNWRSVRKKKSRCVRY